MIEQNELRINNTEEQQPIVLYIQQQKYKRIFFYEFVTFDLSQNKVWHTK